MKTVIFGDIHGRTVWRDILEKEQPDRVIFLGDYVSSHENISEAEQIQNLKDILDYKETHDNVIMLRGNHDMEALRYYWAECSPHFRNGYFNDPKHKEKFLANTQWVYVDDTIIYSHAGISQYWFDSLKKRYALIKDIKDINIAEPDEYFGFTAGPDNIWDSFGDSMYQPCTWIRPSSLIKCAVPGTHVVGHTGVRNRVVHLSDIIKDSENYENKNLDIWLCDALGNGSYLVRENDEFKVEQIVVMK